MGRCIRVRIAIEAKQIDLDVGCVAIDKFSIVVQRKTWAICVLVGVEQDVGAVILVVTFEVM